MQLYSGFEAKTVVLEEHYVLCETETEFLSIVFMKVTLQNFIYRLSLHCNPHNINIKVPI